MENKDKFTVGATTITPKQLFNMKDYKELTDNNILEQYAPLKQEVQELKKRTSPISWLKWIALYIVIATFIVAFIAMNTSVETYLVAGLVIYIALPLGLTFLVVAFLKDIYTYSKHKDILLTKDIELKSLEFRYPLINILVDFTTKATYEQESDKAFIYLVNYLSALEFLKDEKVYLFVDETETNYKGNIKFQDLAFYNEESKTLRRYAVHLYKKEEQVVPKSKLLITSIDVHDLKIDGNNVLTESFDKENKYIKM